VTMWQMYIVDAMMQAWIWLVMVGVVWWSYWLVQSACRSCELRCAEVSLVINDLGGAMIGLMCIFVRDWCLGMRIGMRKVLKQAVEREKKDGQVQTAIYAGGPES
jgi:hypothetical protein